MPLCCVPNCYNSTDSSGEVKFYNFPRKSWEQRELWIAAVKRIMPAGSTWRAVPKTLICNTHFVGGKKSIDENSESYVPTLFPADQKRKSLSTSVSEPKKLKACTTSIKKNYPHQIEEAKDLSPGSQEPTESTDSNIPIQVTEHCYTSQSIYIKVEQNEDQGSHHLEDEESGLCNGTIPPNQLCNPNVLLDGVKQEPEDQLEASHQANSALIKQEYDSEVETKQESSIADDKQDVEVKQETDDECDYPNVVPPETIFLDEFPVEATVKREGWLEQYFGEDEIQITSVRSLSEPHSSSEKNIEKAPRVKSSFPGTSQITSVHSLTEPHSSSDKNIEKAQRVKSSFPGTSQITSVHSLTQPHSSIVINVKETQRVKSSFPGTCIGEKSPLCSTCKHTFDSLHQFLNHECQPWEKVQPGSMWRCEVWQCEFCQNIFDSERTLDSHIKKKHEQRNVAAPVTNTPSCPQLPVFSRPVYGEFYTHLCMYHVKYKDEEEENSMIAKSLLIEFVEEENLKGKVYKCTECSDTIYTTKEYFNYHFRTMHSSCNKLQDFVSCKLCSRCHKDVNQMEIHLKHEHMEYWKYRVDPNSLYRCATCEDKFASCLVTEKNYGPVTERSIDLKHIEVTQIVATAGKSYFRYTIKQPCEHFIDNYSCVMCQPSATYFHTAAELTSHLQSHLEDLAFRSCSSCSVPCYNMDEYYAHVQAGCDDSELNFQHFKTNDSQTVSCKKCSVTMGNPCSYEIHKLTCHRSKKCVPELADGKYSCPICGVIFSDQKCLYAHCFPYSILFPQKSMYCEECAIQFQSSMKFQEHSMTYHETADCFKCEICGVCLDTRLQFDKHVSKEHNTQLIHCTQCFANVRINPKLTISHFKSCNIRLVSNERLYSCPICGLRFETFNTLINHIKIDMQLLPLKKFQCRHCLNYFFTEYNLCAHIVNGKCQSCKLNFCCKQRLAVHGPCTA